VADPHDQERRRAVQGADLRAQRIGQADRPSLPRAAAWACGLGPSGHDVQHAKVAVIG
jgi:hypothetical protein